MSHVIVAGSFDNLQSRHMRLLQEAARLGSVRVLLWSDRAIQAVTGTKPKFTQEERRYFVEAIRYVDGVSPIDDRVDEEALTAEYATPPACWVVDEASNSSAKRISCQQQGIEYRVIPETALRGFPEEMVDAPDAESGKKKVIVTGCYDWFHSGHVRFFEEVSELGELYVVVGHDANIRLLKGEGHPMYGQDERRYMAGSIRFVKQALVASGDGWLDAEPEIERIKPDIYAVNEDGHRPEKQEYCQTHGITYQVLKRLPKEGLPKRQSTDLRGF